MLDHAQRSLVGGLKARGTLVAGRSANREMGDGLIAAKSAPHEERRIIASFPVMGWEFHWQALKESIAPTVVNDRFTTACGFFRGSAQP